MLVNHINIPFYASNNKLFRSEISALVEMILGAEDIGRIPYQMSTEENFENKRSKYFLSKNQLVSGKSKRELLEIIGDSQMCASNLKVNGMGKLELSLINYIFARHPQNIVITGALGSGKSELINYVLNHIDKHKIHEACASFENCPLKSNIHIRIDFNTYTRASKNHERDFLSYMFYKIGGKVIEIFSNKETIDSFIRWTDNGKSNLKNDYFISLVDDVVEKFDDWDQFSPQRQIKKIYSWILKRFEKKGDFANGVNAFLEMINFYHSKYPKISRSCFLFIYDNIDGLPDEIQNVLIAQIMRISKETSIKTIITSRLTTFAHIKGNSSFSFGLFENAGKQPIFIVKKRLENYHKEKDTDIEYIRVRKLIGSDILLAFDKRLDYILNLLNQDESRLTNVLNSLSGLSIRRALRLSRRLFYSFVVPWEQSTPVQDLLIRSIFSYDFRDGMMRVDDNRLSNIFIEPKSSKNSLLSLRILSVLNDYRNENRFITKSDLITHLSLFKLDNENLVRESTRYLRKERKRLIFINGLGLTDYDSYEMENTEIHITTAGQFYIENLCSELGYIQSCFEIIDWELKFSNSDIANVYNFITNRLTSNFSSSINTTKDLLTRSIDDFTETNNNISSYLPNEVDNHDLLSRIGFIRKALKLFLFQDIAETIIYIHNKNNKHEQLVLKEIKGINELVSLSFIYKVSNSVFYILKNKTDKVTQDSNFNELLYWYDFIILANEWNSIFFEGNVNKNISRLINKFSEYEAQLTKNII